MSKHNRDRRRDGRGHDPRYERVGISTRPDHFVLQMGRALCFGLRATLGDRTCWVISTDAEDPRIAGGEVPDRRPGDHVAFLYHRGHCCGALQCGPGPDHVFAAACLALWETREMALPRPGKWNGPEGLLEWVRRHPGWWRAAYHKARLLGYNPDTVVMATPTAEDVDTPPASFDFLSRDQARAKFTPLGAAEGFDTPAPPGMFIAVATCAGGPLKGSTILYVPVPAPGEVLPSVVVPGAADN
jgi:hypothetical protein